MMSQIVPVLLCGGYGRCSSQTANAPDWTVIIELAAILVSLISLAITGWRYVNVRRAEQRQQRFLNYHDIIHKMVTGHPDGTVMLDSQLAGIFELRNYKEYRDLTARILRGLLDGAWANKPGTPRLRIEVEETLAALKV